eukprot:COSAG02_NODE_52322_length_308_cov_1.167464_1_plen_38_part_10
MVRAVAVAAAVCPLYWQWKAALGLLLGTASILTPHAAA